MRTEDEVVRVNEVQSPKISWGAIFTGAFIVFAFNAMLMGLGGGIGFASFDPEQGDSIGRGAMIAAGVYWFIAGLISLFAGGYVAARMAGFYDRGIAGLHGLSSWALASTVTIVLVGTGVGSALGAAVGFVGSGVRSALRMGANNAQNLNVNGGVIREEVRRLLRDTGKAELQPGRLENQAANVPQEAARAQANEGGDAGQQTVNREASQVAGAVDREAVANVLSSRLGLSKEESLSLIEQSEEQAGNVIASMKARAQDVAGSTANVAAYAGWITFLSLLSGAIVSYLGGLMGTPSASRPAEVIVRRASTKLSTT